MLSMLQPKIAVALKQEKVLFSLHPKSLKAFDASNFWVQNRVTSVHLFSKSFLSAFGVSNLGVRSKGNADHFQPRMFRRHSTFQIWGSGIQCQFSPLKV